MAACNSPGENTCPTLEQAPPAATDWTLPLDLLLEIVARSDIATLVTSTLACKLLRRDILSPSFIRRVTGQGGIVPPCILVRLNYHGGGEDDPLEHFSLIHPDTPAASSFLNDHISSRFPDDLLREHYPLASSGGLILFRRCQNFTNRLANLCVYDPLSGHRTLFSDPPGVASIRSLRPPRYVFLTAADGINSSFMLFAFHHVTVPDQSYSATVNIHIATSTSNAWARVMTSHNTIFFSQGIYENIVVLYGGVICWLKHGEICFYNVCTMEQETIKIPSPIINFHEDLHLGSYYSHDGKKLLRVLTLNKFKISVWHQLPNGDWASEAVMIDVEEKLQSLHPYSYRGILVQFDCIGEKSNIVVLRKDIASIDFRSRNLLIIIDLETKEIREKYCPPFSPVAMEIDMSSRLRAMKVLP
jgi:hypothetical protein